MRHKRQRLFISLSLLVWDCSTSLTTKAATLLLLYATTFVLYSSYSSVGSVEALSIYMGLLKVGSPKSWDSSKKDLAYIRKAGVRQFISTYNRVKDFKGDELLWGDEIEYGIFKLDAASRKVRLSLRARDVMNALNEKEGNSRGMGGEGCNWVPEYGAWMVEATPDRPYTGYTTDLLRVERNMRLRRKRLLTVLDKDEVAPTISAPFRLGAQGNDGSIPPTTVGGPRTCSDYIGDGIINPHPRFGTLTANIRQRRGDKVNIRVPLFRDLHTPEYNHQNSATSTSILPLLLPPLGVDGTDGCCGSDSQQLWRYGKDDACQELHGNNYVRVGCSKSSSDEQQYGDQDVQDGVVLQKWLVDVKCAGCRGLFYRRAPNEIVPDADWPRNGNVVVGHELQTIPGWIRLQNGYYLPMHSDDGKIAFLHKISARSNNATATTAASTTASTVAQNSDVHQRIVGSDTPLFRGASTAAAAAAAAGAMSAAAVVIDTKEATTATVATSSLQDGTSTTTLPQQPREEQQARSEDSLRAAIHMDAMAFGMGCCCLQITFQAKDVDESRFIYDQLAVMAPIMMALTAATPILKGRLADTDARWGVISESVDDRTPAERGRSDPNAPYPEYNANGQRRIYKSRYDSISTYIYQGAMVDEQRQPNKTPRRGKGNDRVLNMYNDVPVPVDEDSYQLLRANGIDPALAQHVAALFVRDPLVVFEDAVEEVDDETQTEHWESIQSTNWQTVRWKPPPPRNSPNDPHIGWRTEFRSMELQLTDFENAAFTAFIVLLTRVILTFDLNLYIPMSRVDANMQRAHSRNSAAKGKFFFRRHMAPLEEGDDGYGVKYVSMFSRATTNGAATSTSSPNGSTTSSSSTSPSTVEGGGQNKVDDGVSSHRRTAPCAPGSAEENAYEEMTMGEIMCGKGEYFPGLIPLIFAYLDHINCDKITLERLTMYLDFIERRARGELLTPATWMRSYVRNHPAYKQDSVVSDEIAYDLTLACTQIGEGRLHIPELLGDVKIKLVTTEGAYDAKLESIRAQNDVVLELLRRYTSRKAFCKESSKQ